MELLRFNEQELIRALGLLPPTSRIAFAAAVVERLLPSFALFARQIRGREADQTQLTAILDRLWDDLQGTGATVGRVQEDLDLCMMLIPNEDTTSWIPEQAYAEDAASALAYALRCRLRGDPQEAAWAARRAYEALDQFVVRQERVDTNTPRAEDRILAHPLMQAELGRQRCDLQDLVNTRDSLGDVVALIRGRAKDASENFFIIGTR